MQLLCDVRLDRVDAQGWWRDPRKAQNVLSGDDLRCSKHGVAEPDVDPEGLPVRLAGDPARCTKAKAIVDHRLALNLRVVGVRSDFEREEVAEIEPCRCLESCENAVGWTREPQIDVIRRSGAVETKLQDEPTLERRGVAQHLDDPRQEAIEHQELPLAGEGSARLR